MVGTVLVAGAMLVAGSDVSMVTVAGVFGSPGAGRSYITYDTAAVPVGGRFSVEELAETTGDGKHRTRIELRVQGLQPDRAYGAHVHTRPCGSRPEDSGPHYQHIKDPKPSSGDPAYANRRNEVWLDFTTDAKGEARVVSENGWRFRKGEARSVVLHEHPTSSKPGQAGQAGKRLACMTVPFA